MKRKVFASVLSALMVTSSVSGVLMADSNEETSIPEEAEVVIEEVSEESDELEIESEDNEVDSEEQVLDVEGADETEVEEVVFDETEESDEEIVIPVYEEYEVPGTDTLAVSSKTIKLGDKATGYLSDDDGDNLYENLEIKGTGDLYDLISAKPELVFVKTVKISSGITSIGNNMFSGCQRLKEVEIPNTVTRIGERAFLNCESLCSVKLPNSLTNMGESAFNRCEYLKEINIPSSLTEIPDNCFRNCEKLSITEIPKSIKRIGNHAFSNCTELQNIKLNDGIEYIGDSAFFSTYIESINLPDTINYIGEYAFYETNIKSAVIPKNVTVINAYAFAYCLSLKEVTFCGEVTRIEKAAFAQDQSIIEFTLPETVNYVGDAAFSCVWPKRFTILSTNANVGVEVFYNTHFDELIMPCSWENVFREEKSSHADKVVITHVFDHSSDTKCNNCGAVREIHTVTMDQFVERLYTTCLGRKSEAAGKEYWIKKLVNGATGAEAAHQFFFSSEFTSKKLSDSEFITRLYKTFMDRNPDTNGLNYWLGKIKAGYTREQVFQGFINSQEWADMCLQYGILSGGSRVSNTSKEPSRGCYDFATRLYTTCLGRKPDEAGLKDWVMKLARLNTTGTKAAHGFFFSKEFTSKNYSNEEYIKRLYRTFMGREADSNGIKYWQDKFKSGYTREQVFQGFANSAEFEKICIQYGILK